MNYELGSQLRIFYESKRLTTGLSDVAITLWDPTGTEIITGSSMTELGSGIYYFDYTPTSVGTYIHRVDSPSNQRILIDRLIIQDTSSIVSSNIATGGGGGALSADIAFDLKRIADNTVRRDDVGSIVDQVIRDAISDQMDILIKESSEKTKEFSHFVEETKSKVGSEIFEVFSKELENNLTSFENVLSKKEDSFQEYLNHNLKLQSSIKTNLESKSEILKKEVDNLKNQSLKFKDEVSIFHKESHKQESQKVEKTNKFLGDISKEFSRLLCKIEENKKVDQESLIKVREEVHDVLSKVRADISFYSKDNHNHIIKSGNVISDQFYKKLKETDDKIDMLEKSIKETKAPIYLPLQKGEKGKDMSKTFMTETQITNLLKEKEDSILKRLSRIINKISLDNQYASLEQDRKLELMQENE